MIKTPLEVEFNMLSEEVIRKAIEKVRRYDIFGNGWNEGSMIPITEHLKVQEYMLMAILEEVPVIEQYHYCVRHRRVYFNGNLCPVCNGDEEGLIFEIG
jgi:hypothetical protein